MRNRPRAFQSRKRAGFTLIETLAALAVASAILVAAGGLIHHVAHYFDRGTRGVDDAERFALAMDRLAGDFAALRFVPEKREASAPLRLDAPSDVGQRSNGAKDAKMRMAPVAFDAGVEKIIFVSASAVGPLAAKEEVLSLTVEETADDFVQLVRRRAPWLGPRAGLYVSPPQDPVVLLKGRYRISFSYARVDAKGALSWTNSWRGETEPPRFIRLNLQDPATGASLVAAADFIVWTTAPSSCSQGQARCLPGGTQEPVEKPEQPAREPK